MKPSVRLLVVIVAAVALAAYRKRHLPQRHRMDALAGDRRRAERG